MSRQIANRIIFEFLTHGDEYGMDNSEGKWRPLEVIPESVTNVEELIDYGASLIDKIDEQAVVSALSDIECYIGEDWTVVVGSSEIWHNTLRSFIPSIGCITGDGSNDVLEDLLQNDLIERGVINQSGIEHYLEIEIEKRNK